MLITFQVSFLLKNLFTPNEFSSFRWIYQSPYLVLIYKVYLRFHSLKSSLRLWSQHSLSVGHRIIIIDDQYVTMLSHKQTKSLKLMACSARLTQLMYLLSQLIVLHLKGSDLLTIINHLRLHIAPSNVYGILQCYNFIKFYLSPISLLENKF